MRYTNVYWTELDCLGSVPGSRSGYALNLFDRQWGLTILCNQWSLVEVTGDSLFVNVDLVTSIFHLLTSKLFVPNPDYIGNVPVNFEL